MGYRFFDTPPNPEDMLQRFLVRNGATLKLAFECYYIEKHDAKLHDHIGWPAPPNADRICQIASNITHGNMVDRLDPIHLLEEGYSEAVVVFEDEDTAQNVFVETWIDVENDNIVRVRMDTDFPTFTDKPIDLVFTVLVKKTWIDEQTMDTKVIKDAVAHCIASVLPGAPYPLHPE